MIQVVGQADPNTQSSLSREAGGAMNCNKEARIGWKHKKSTTTSTRLLSVNNCVITVRSASVVAVVEEHTCLHARWWTAQPKDIQLSLDLGIGC